MLVEMAQHKSDSCVVTDSASAQRCTWIPIHARSPELVVQSRAGGEVSQLLADGLGEQAEQGLAPEAGHADVGGDGPAAMQHARIGISLACPP